MLKFKDSNGTIVGELKDEDTEPTFFTKIKDTKEVAEEETIEESQEK